MGELTTCLIFVLFYLKSCELIHAANSIIGLVTDQYCFIKTAKLRHYQIVRQKVMNDIAEIINNETLGDIYGVGFLSLRP